MAEKAAETAEAAAPPPPPPSADAVPLCTVVGEKKRFEIKKWNAVALWAWGALRGLPVRSRIFFLRAVMRGFSGCERAALACLSHLFICFYSSVRVNACAMTWGRVIDSRKTATREALSPTRPLTTRGCSFSLARGELN